MRQIADIERRIRQHVEQRWANDVAAEVASAPTWWPRRYALGRPDPASIENDYGDIIDLVDQWRTWASENGATVVDSNIRVDRTTYPVLSHILVPSLDVAARVAGEQWMARIIRGREYANAIDAQFPDRRDVLAQTVAATADWSPVDVELLTQAAAWFEEHPASGLSAREVPLAGFHTKWLETRTQVVARLSGLSELGLLPRHPSRIHFTYIDPEHLAAGGRRHDSATVGDTFTPAYTPGLVVICENKDTAIHFPQVPGAIAVEGAGSGAGAFAAFGWLRDAHLVVYWGDMDTDGLRILDQFRKAGIQARSLFMDVPTFERWQAYGTNLDRRGNPINPDGRPAPANLEEHERALYSALNDPAAAGPRRVEQERIPLREAREMLVRMHATSYRS
ncbi:Wadjet anti-phage system protein JetD domain-containing protein [Microbacterium sp. CJ88]|uniref:Wadjet anti-phage system protein JetD domain-containing protein n=1 Tax=Microbacterium sp. CJ88 TaxID=3445672 RepID=UPI003F654B01